MGFIGAGAIVRKGNLVTGLTTAATLWFVTMVGLCFGGGQLQLGFAGLFLGMAILWGLKYVEKHARTEQHATLIIITEHGGPADASLRSSFKLAGLHVSAFAVAYEKTVQRRRLIYQLKWRADPSKSEAPDLIAGLAGLPGVQSLDWNPQLIEAASEPGEA